MKNKVVLHYTFIAALFSIILILSFANVAQAESSDYKSETYVAVSYTHLTLPTICSV